MVAFGRILTALLCCNPLLLGLADASGEDAVQEALQTIAQAGPNAAGSLAAAEAVTNLKDLGPQILPQLLKAMNTENVVALNWYRQVYDAVTEGQNTGSQDAAQATALPYDLFRKIALDGKQPGRLRRLMTREMEKYEPGFMDRHLASLLQDDEFREEAVEFVLQQGDALLKENDQEAAVEQFTAAFAASRRSDQVITTASRLNANGIEVDIIDHMGFVNRWYLLGPFDAPGMSGFEASFPPEENVDLTADYRGQEDATIQWQPFQTSDQLGQLNLVQAIGAVEEAVGFAYAEIESPRDQDIEVRCGADDNLSVWVNGEKVFARRQWLNGIRLDRFTAPCHLREGSNAVLVKICQGPQHKNPAVPNNWSFQLRFCDATGAAVGTQILLPAAFSNPSK